jgi:hypothetical protein
MPLPRLARIVALGVLVATPGSILYTRGFGWQPGAAPSPFRGGYATEEAWIVGEIVRDISEMSAFPDRLPAAPAVQAVAPDTGRYLVNVHGVAPEIDVDLRRDLWSPAAFGVLARAAIDAHPSHNRSAPGSASLFHPALIELSPLSLMSAAQSISRALALNMRDAGLHESAALVVGAFALRESAAGSADVRWAMNRMTAHLAMASALDGRTASIDGRLAEAMLLAFANHQTRALTALGRLTTPDVSRALEAWIRALRLRVAQDWRAIPIPARATRLEKLEYFRARLATVRTAKGSAELEALDEPPAVEWIRLIESHGYGIEDGWLLKDAVDWEFRESRDVFRRLNGRAIDGDEAAALNLPAPRCIGENGPDILPWGAWAEFAERHLSMFVRRADVLYRQMLGSDAAADLEKNRLITELGGLWMFPAATVSWARGPHGRAVDSRHINHAVSRTLAAPQRVTAVDWSVVETASNLAAAGRRMPNGRRWFIRPAPRTAYDAGQRVRDSGHRLIADDLAAMMRDAPYDYQLASEYLTMKYGERPPYAEIDRVFGARKNYDLRVLRLARQFVSDSSERLALLRRSCEVSAAECTALGLEHARNNRKDEATAAYRRAFADQSVNGAMLARAPKPLGGHEFRTYRIEGWGVK